jgi:hypothetical protein
MHNSTLLFKNHEIRLDELAAREQVLLGRVHQVNGEKDTREDCLEEIFREYKDIHFEYVELAIRYTSIEALKRAIFIQWYSMSEPEYLSGINQLDEQATYQSLDMLLRLIILEQVDEEFRWMLKLYFDITNDFIPPNSPYQTLWNFIHDLPAWGPDKLIMRKFQNRGQMGNYWKSVSQQ